MSTAASASAAAIHTTTEQHPSTSSSSNAAAAAAAAAAGAVAKWQAEERAVLRECVYALQGISGERLLFFNSSSNSNGEIGSNEEVGFRFQKSVAHCCCCGCLEQNKECRGCCPPPELLFASQLGSGARDAISICGAAGQLFQRIQAYIVQHQQQQNGSVARALSCALALELQDCQRFISSSAALLQHPPLHTSTTTTTTTTTLRELLAAVEQHQPESLLSRFKTLALIVSAGEQLRGADLLTHLHRHVVHHGGTRHHVPLLTKLLVAASQPWFQMLYGWTVQGRLLDPALEFFIVVVGGGGANNGNSYSRTDNGYGNYPGNNETLRTVAIPDRDLWRTGYRLERSKVPVGILEPDLVDLVFIVGKGVNYIHRCLHDAEWSLADLLEEETANDGVTSVEAVATEEAPSTTARANRLAQLGYSYVSPTTTALRATQTRTHRTQHVLRSTLERSAAMVHSHILKSLRDDHCLVQHLFALKQFLLLGQGDFYSSLMDGIHSEYQHHHVGVIGVYRHNLAAIVESALRSTNASGFAPDILERLQVERLIEKDDDARYMFAPSRTNQIETDDDDEAPSDRRTVWDIFLLDYIVPDPLVAIVHPEAMETYRRMFLFLFGLNKVEFLLNLTWRQSSVLQRALHTNAQHLVIKADTNQAYAQAIILLRQVAMTRQSMVHFVCNVKSYLMFEVLEGSWKRLVPIIEEAETLDEVIQAHDNYLNGIYLQSLLHSGQEPLDDLDLAGKLETLLRLAGNFCSYQDELFGDALEAADRAAQKRREAELLADQGSWGFSREREAAEQETCFGLSDTTKLEELDRLSQDFNEKMFSLLQALDSKLNGSPAWLNEDRAPATPSSFPDVGAHGRYEFDDDQDLDSLRFLASQLDHNKFYGITNF